MAKKNDLGVKGWVYGGRYSLQRYAYLIQRITGLGIIFYLVVHLFVTAQKNVSPEAWDAAMNTVKKIHIGEWLVFVAIIIHALNGIRLVFAEFGLTLGKPIKNVYPYKTCVERNRVFFITVMILAFIIVVVGSLDLFNVIKAV